MEPFDIEQYIREHRAAREKRREENRVYARLLLSVYRGLADSLCLSQMPTCDFEEPELSSRTDSGIHVCSHGVFECPDCAKDREKGGGK